MICARKRLKLCVSFILTLNTIGEGLKDNHTILGLHMQGNDARVDSLGFVTP